tara:strand:- start:2341 stop:2829 length:489 start_codon:yes stop_codon:yes gene_type:complete
MEIYFCINCKNILGTQNDFNNKVVLRFNKESSHPGLIRIIEYSKKCSKCNCLCTFRESVYQNNSRVLDLSYSSNFGLTSVLNTKSIFSNISEKKQKEIGLKIKEYKQNKKIELEKKEQKILDHTNREIEKIRKQRKRESEEFWDNFISKYPFFGITKWLFGK